MTKTRDLANLADLNFDSGTMVVDKVNDRVGIGTSPSDILHIKDSASTNVLIDAPTDNASLTLQCGSSDAGAEGAFVQFIQNTTPKWQLGMNTDNTFRLYNYNTSSETLQVASSGEVLVGTTDTSVYNNVTGTGVVIEPNSIQVARSGGPTLLLNRQSSDGEIQRFLKDGTTVGDIGVNNGDNLRIQGNSSHSGIEFGTNAIFPHKNGSNVDATIDLGESSLRWKDLYLSGGVYLGGTGSANHLDDYEEGTWTPQIAISNTNVTTTINSAVYNKIGNFVYAHASINFASGTLTGSVRLWGLPFTSNGTYYSRGLSVNDFVDNPERYYMYVSATQGVLRVGGTTQGTGSRDLNGNDILDNNNIAFYFHIFYRTA